MPGVPAPRNISGVVGTDLEALAGLIGRPADLESEVHGRDGAIGLAYLAGLTNQRDIKANLLQPLLGLLAQGHHAAEEIGALLPGTAPRVHTDLQAAAADLLAGRAVLFLAGEDRALSFGAQGWIRHEPKEPSNGRAEAARLPVIAYDRREKTFVPHGLGVFHGDRLAGILTSRETRMFGLFCGKARAAKLQVPMEEMGLVSFTGVSAESKTSLHTVGNRVSFSVEVKARGHLMGMTKPLTRLGPDRTRAIAAATENAIRNEMAKMVRHLQELNADIMGFGELVRGNRPQIWRRLNWDEEFPRVPVRIRVRFTIVQAGTFR